MNRSLTPDSISSISGELKKENAHFIAQYPGDSADRQPVHTVYGGAHLFSSALNKKFSEAALNVLREHAPDARTLAKAIGEEPTDSALWTKVYERVTEKLKKEPVEDFRIDFEDGYGTRPDEEEDKHSEAAALEVAKGMAEKSLPPFIGIRIKPFSQPCFDRSIRTLDIFISTLLEKTDGKLPENFVVTLPKVTIAAQPAALCKAFEQMEKKFSLASNSLKYEFMVETTQSMIDENGHCPLKSFADVGRGRCTGAHFGTYDYTAGCNITAAYQAMDHRSCDFAKEMMKVALSGTGIWLSDGATNVMPVGKDRTVVHRAWKLAYAHIRHSLVGGFYQGWDLHPAQLPIRYAAVYSFFLESLQSATGRLRGFMEKAARATLLGDVFDDAATGQGLLNFFLRGLSCGAITEPETKQTGLSLDEIRTRSFQAILLKRSGR